MKHFLLACSLMLVLGACASKETTKSGKSAATKKETTRSGSSTEAATPTTSAPTATEQAPKAESTPAATTPSSGATVGSEATCVKDKDSRTIKIQKMGEGNGCEVAYTKFEQTNTVASAQNDVDHCSRVFDRIKTNLETAGFTCN